VTGVKIPVMRNRGEITALLCAALAGGCGADGGAGDFPRPAIQWNPATYVAYRADSVMNVDGVLDEAAWQAAPWTDEFVDILGEGAPRPRYRTRAKMLWDDSLFYVAAELEDPHVWATLTTRDAVIFRDNDFEVFIDPDGDSHRYYELEVNAFATEWDLMLLKPYRDGGPAIDSWDIRGLRTGVFVNGTINDPSDVDGGWSVEIAIPWEVLSEAADMRTPPGPGDQWRLNFSRVEWETSVEENAYVKVQDPTTGEPLPEDNWVWSPQGLVNMHYPEMWGVVQFSDVSPGSVVEEVTVPDFEYAKQFLYSVYYSQREWYAMYGRYARTLAELGILDHNARGVRSEPRIEVTPSQYEVTVRVEGDSRLHLAQDGRVWVTER
jgi:hypothetical protein